MALLLEDLQFNREQGQGPNIRPLQLALHQNDHGPAWLPSRAVIAKSRVRLSAST